MPWRHDSYGNIKQQHYKVETESKAFDEWCKRNSVSRNTRTRCRGCCHSGVAPTSQQIGGERLLPTSIWRLGWGVHEALSHSHALSCHRCLLCVHVGNIQHSYRHTSFIERCLDCCILPCCAVLLPCCVLSAAQGRHQAAAQDVGAQPRQTHHSC